MKSDSTPASLHALVLGRVQGVFFRAFVRHQAMVLGLGGYVRNLTESSAVEVVAEGERSQLEQLLRHLRRGPAGARVDKVEVRWEGYSGDFSDFSIRY